MAFEQYEKSPIEETQKFEQDKRFEGDHWVLDSRLETGADVGETLEAKLREAGWTDDEIGLFGLAVNEAVANAIVHGNWGIEKKNYATEREYENAIEEKGKNGGDKKVTVDIEISNHDVTVTVHDEGDTMIDFKDIPDPTTPEGLEKLSGRGRHIYTAGDTVDFPAPGTVVLRKLKRTGEELEK